MRPVTSDETRASGGKANGREARTLPTIGWREWVTLDEFCDTPMKAKIDTGARTSSLHAFDLQLRETEGGTTIARFEVHPLQRSSKNARLVEAEVIEFRQVRSSSGHVEDRPTIRTSIHIGANRFEVDLTLTSRDEMGFRMLLGRAALRRRFLVDPGRSYLQGKSI